MEPGPGDTMQSKTEIVPAVKKLASLVGNEHKSSYHTHAHVKP